MKASPLQSNFNGGEFSPLLQGRVDAERYRAGLQRCLNFVPTIQGGLIRRSGTKFVAEVKDSSKETRIERFEFSTTQAYILEFGNLYIRFYKDNGQIVLTSQNITAITNANPAVVTYAGADTYANGDEVYIDGIVGAIGTYLNTRNFKVANVNAGANTFELQYMDGTNVNSTSMGAYSSGGTLEEVYTVTSPYLEADLFQLKFTQSADVLYITHQDYAPRKLTRTGHTSWTLTTITFADGPYLPTNTTATTLTPSAATGAGVTLTASAVTGINDDTGFAATDVGRTIRMLEGSVWGDVTITGFTSTTVVTVTVNRTLTDTTSKSSWRMGAWSDTTGYPSCSTFHEDRLFFGGPTNYPQRIDGSKTGSYEDFSPTNTDGTISDNNAVSFTLNASDVNATRWLVSDEKGLIVGTVGGPWIVRPSSQQEALSPTNISAKKSGSDGAADVAPLQIGKATLFVQRSQRKIRELTYFYEVDGFRSPDLTEIAEHVTKSGLVQIAYQSEPQSVLWGSRVDGVLVGMTYRREPDSLQAGWHRHIVGGVSDAAGNDALVESVAVIPSSDGSHDEVWMVVKRRINGGTKRYIEYMTPTFDDTLEQKEAFFVDGGLTYDSPVTITGATAANPVVITANSHGFSNGDTVVISDVEGMEEINDLIFTVANKTANTFELTNNLGANINGTAYTAYVSGGYARKRVSTVSGLWHLEGQSVNVLGDGAVQTSQTVTNGAVTLANPAAIVQLGLNIVAQGQMLRLEAGSQDGTALGKTRRTNLVGFMFYRSLGFKFGTDFDDLDTLQFPEGTSDYNQPLYTGILSESLESDYDFENNICWQCDTPLPCTLLAVMPSMTTQDR